MMTSILTDRIPESLAVAAPRRSIPQDGSKATKADIACTALASHPPTLTGSTLLLAARVAGGSSRVLMLAGADARTTAGACAADLGRALVQLGHGSVLLVEADPERRALEQHLGFKQTSGLLNELTPEHTGDTTSANEISTGLHVLAWGKPSSVGASSAVAAHPLATPQLRTFLQRQRKRYDWVLLNAASPEGSADAALLAREVDQVLLLLCGGYQRRSALRALQARFAEAKLPPIGLILA